jgi:hypothetical protein
VSAATGRHARRRRLPHPGVLLLAVLAVALGAAGLVPASAARLDVAAHQLTTASAAACSSVAVAATSGTVSGGSSTQVVLSNVPAACQGKTATLRLYAADGTALATTDTTTTLATTDTTTVTVPAYTVSGAAGLALTVGTWSLGTTWTVKTGTGGSTGPVTPGPGTSFDQVTWTQVSSSGTQACVTVQVSGAAGTVWRVDIHTDQRPYNGITSGSGFQVHSPWWGQKLTTDPVSGVLSIGGQPGREALTAGEVVTVTVCHYDLPAPAYDASLTYTQTSQAVTGNVGYACMATTVGVSGTAQFYAGWYADVSLQPLIDFLAARGATANLATASAPGNYTLVRTGTTVRITPTGWDTWGVRDDTSQTFQVCLQP